MMLALVRELPGWMPSSRSRHYRSRSTLVSVRRQRLSASARAGLPRVSTANGHLDTARNTPDDCGAGGPAGDAERTQTQHRPPLVVPHIDGGGAHREDRESDAEVGIAPAQGTHVRDGLTIKSGSNDRRHPIPNEILVRLRKMPAPDEAAMRAQWRRVRCLQHAMLRRIDHLAFRLRVRAPAGDKVFASPFRVSTMWSVELFPHPLPWCAPARPSSTVSTAFNTPCCAQWSRAVRASASECRGRAAVP